MKLEKSTLTGNKTVQISGSKSISNRLLILESLFKNIKIGNLSNSQDTQLLKKALSEKDADVVDIHHAGTAMRFLTSYYSIMEGKTTVLTGSKRMTERPIKNLVNALRDLGVEIEYLQNEGFPPLKITGRKITQSEVSVPSNISSQFITSLLLIAGKLENGLKVNLVGEVTSRSYIEMTLDILTKFGITSSFEGNTIQVEPFHPKQGTISYEVESDWSSASYFYSICALGRKTIHLKSFYKASTQGDAAIATIYEKFFGITTIFSEEEHTITLQPQPDFSFPEKIVLDMNNCPDIAQTLCVTAAALKIPFDISGLGTLRVKETDRLLALYNELKKLGTETEITDLTISSIRFGDPEESISITTYQDHRMAMSFAPFCLIKELNIEDEDVVEKSYPMFWEDLASVTIQ
ncbi:3-phosphoshikimate 1-carboxyvinyltransferase [Chryseobacterium sp.]|uniref:3-phosphoshikimate 1-carboxyvinyltransferase n=1 Tax=Chryseobacterium sp. TaxID=1871047 RepID=UPI0025BF305F|nr:3-phosphoshikimate 1-carboxyvinyltransferase [Chryseobacterium sp.]MBV8328231.1 3-phosphoshikimate 1-carboxyvinyltransferase [Chryseobacterium sp.]